MYIVSGMSSKFALVSISTSVMSIAYTSSVLSFDKDCNPACRKTAPHFYGYVPDGAALRSVVFISILVFTTAHITLKVLGVALLSTLGSLPVVTA